MKTVYLVMDDYESQVRAAFSTRELADAFADREARGNEPAKVERWSVDVEDPYREIAFEVSLVVRSEYRRGPYWVCLPFLYRTTIDAHSVAFAEKHEGSASRRVWRVYVWAHDRNEALRKGAELIAPVARAAGVEVPEWEEVK